MYSYRFRVNYKKTFRSLADIRLFECNSGSSHKFSKSMWNSKTHRSLCFSLLSLFLHSYSSEYKSNDTKKNRSTRDKLHNKIMKKTCVLNPIELNLNWLLWLFYRRTITDTECRKRLEIETTIRKESRNLLVSPWLSETTDRFFFCAN